MTFANDLFRTLLGMTILLGICFLLSKDRKAINWRLVGIGVGLQFLLAFLMLKADGVSYVVDIIASGFRSTLDFTAA
ncbi:MAG: Na+ dependent nucleoside transporter N-terminal domain-containing protein, partial [Bacteroidota bacterium]